MLKHLRLCALMMIALSPYPSFAAWQAVLVSGDDSIENFDNSRLALGSLLQQRGLKAENQQHLSSEFRAAYQEGFIASVADLSGISRSFAQLNRSAAPDGCVFYLSSHGNENQGVLLRRAYERQLTPAQLNTALNWGCGNAPTVVLISACYSGQFIKPLHADNRIILTAAAADRPSFGCSEDETYTFWDGCLIENLPHSETWEGLYQQTRQCINRKELALGYPASKPKAFFGKDMQQQKIAFY